MPPVLSCYPSLPDERDYVAAAFLDVAAAALVSEYEAQTSLVYNQGSKPTCTGNAGALLRTLTETPEAGAAILFDPDDLYAEQKKIDGIAGDGSTARASVTVQYKIGALARSGPNAGKRLKIASYARCDSRDEMKAGILAGGVQVATAWPSNWMPNPGLNPLPSPGPVGSVGHSWTAVGFSDARGCYRGQNSWGSAWGLRGRFWVRYEDFEKLKWEAWKTVDAPDPSGGSSLMIPTMPVDLPVGEITLHNDADIRALNESTGAIIPGAYANAKYPVFERARLGIAQRGRAAGTIVYRTMVGNVRAFFFGDNVLEYRPAATGAAHTFTVTRDDGVAVAKF